jgi:hypothetical protein
MESEARGDPRCQQRRESEAGECVRSGTGRADAPPRGGDNCQQEHRPPDVAHTEPGARQVDVDAAQGERRKRQGGRDEQQHVEGTPERGLETR